MSTSAYAINAAHQLPRSALFGNTYPSPPPGLSGYPASTSTRPSPPPGLSSRPVMQSPPRFIAARAQAENVRRSSLEKVVPAVSRQEVIRQTEPVSIGPEESLEDVLSFNLSPSTELNRAVAFSVAESALEGDSEDDGIDIDHRIRMLERRMTNSSASKSTALSAAAPVFQFKPKFTLPWEEAEAKKVGMDVLSYQNKQMFASQGVVFRPEAIKIDTSAESIERPRKTLSHSRSRSDIPSMAKANNNTFVLNTPIQPSGSFAPEPEKEVETEQEAIALLPPPRCITPLPFKRPSFAEAMLLPPAQVTEKDKGFKNGMPTLAEISARYKAGKSRASSVSSDKENDLPVRPKRYSLESTDSFTSDKSFGDNGYGSSIASGPSLPATPRKSRLPAFLQHGRSNSSGSSSMSDDVILYSPTKSVSFADELKAPQTPEAIYPELRVTPPSVNGAAAKAKTGGFMQVMLEDGEDNLPALDTMLPTITCTPATAPGLPGVSPLRMLEAQIKQNQRVEKRQERAQIMLSTLQRRRAPGVAA